MRAIRTNPILILYTPSFPSLHVLHKASLQNPWTKTINNFVWQIIYSFEKKYSKYGSIIWTKLTNLKRLNKGMIFKHSRSQKLPLSRHWSLLAFLLYKTLLQNPRTKAITNFVCLKIQTFEENIQNTFESYQRNWQISRDLTTEWHSSIPNHKNFAGQNIGACVSERRDKRIKYAAPNLPHLNSFYKKHSRIIHTFRHPSRSIIERQQGLSSHMRSKSPNYLRYSTYITYVIS